MTVALPLDVLPIIISFVTNMTLIDAIKCGDLDLVKLLVTTNASECTAQHMDEAATCGHLEMVRFLHRASPAGCTPAAMNTAICYGHVEVVKFLHFNRTEGCTIAGVCQGDRTTGPAVARFLLQHRPMQVQVCTLRHAVGWNDLDLIVDFLRVRPSAKTARAKSEVAKSLRSADDKIKFLKVLYEKGTDKTPSRALVFAVKRWSHADNLDVFKYLVDQGEGFVQEAMMAAIRERQLDVIQLLLEAARVQLDSTEVSQLIDLAADRSYMLDSGPIAFVDECRVIVEMFREKFPDAVCSPGKFISAAERGNLGMVKALHCADRTETCGVALLRATINHHQGVMKYLAPHCEVAQLHEAAVAALDNGHFYTAKFLVEFCRERNGTKTELSGSITDCSLEMRAVLDRVYQHGPNEKSTQALMLAARSDNLGVVAYLAQRNIGDLHAAMMAAIGCGHLNIVRYLIEHTSVTANEDSKRKWMAKAAGSGQLEVLIFLHESRALGLVCPPTRINHAASKGHLAIVQFLHMHRTEGFSTQAMDGAAYGNHIEVVRFLHENRSEGCTNRAFERSAERGLTEMVKLLLEILPSRCNVHKGILLARKNGFVETVAALESLRARRKKMRRRRT